MSDDHESIFPLVELGLGLPGAREDELELSLADTPEDRAAADDSRALAGILQHLRETTSVEVTVAMHAKLLARAQQEVGSGDPDSTDALVLPQARQEHTPLVDLLEYCSGEMSDREQGQLEKELARQPGSQSDLMATGKLVAALNFLRETTAVEPPPRMTENFARRVTQHLDEELQFSTISGEWIPDFTEVIQHARSQPPVVGVVAADEKPTRQGSLARLALAACLLLGLGLSGWGIAQSWPQPRATVVRLDEVRSAAQLRDLSPQLDQQIGLALLDWGQTNPEDLANWQLLDELTQTGHDAEALKFAEFLPSQPRRPPAWHEQLPSPSDWLPLGLAAPVHAAPAQAAGAPQPSTGEHPLRTSLAEAIRQWDHAEAERLTAGENNLRWQLVRVWALLGLGEREQAGRLVRKLDASDELPLTAAVYLAGARRSLGQPEAAAAQFETLRKRLPALAFHLGHLYLVQLRDEERAQAAFQDLQAMAERSKLRHLSEYARFGLEVTPQPQPLLVLDRPARWLQEVIPVHGHPVHRVHYDVSPRGPLHWSQLLSDQQAGELVLGSPNWEGYQVTADCLLMTDADPGRANEGPALGRQPELVFAGYYQGHDRGYRLVVSEAGLQWERRHPHPLGGYVTQLWPATTTSGASPLVPGRWYRAKLRFQPLPDGSLRLAAKLWPKAEAEPTGWQIEQIDPQPISDGGQVALSALDCQAQFDQLRVDQFQPRD